jgi:micrococcal nuclease
MRGRDSGARPSPSRPSRAKGDRDAYGRLLRYVILADGSNINEEMVRKGYAHVFDKFNFTLKPRFKAAEADAKHEKLGVWGLAAGSVARGSEDALSPS